MTFDQGTFLYSIPKVLAELSACAILRKLGVSSTLHHILIDSSPLTQISISCDVLMGIVIH